MLYCILQVVNLCLQHIESGLPLVSHLEGGVGFRRFLGMGGTMRESSGSRVVGVDDVKGVSLVVLEYAYEGKLAEDGRSSGKLKVKLVGYCPDEVVYCLINFLGRRVGRRGAGESIELVELECRLLSVASPSMKLVGAGNGGNMR